MAFAIARISKQKSSSLGAVNNHNMRLTDTPNAKPNGIFKRLVGDANASTSDLVYKRLEQAGVTKHRKDAVVAVELVLTASPEYFRPDKPSEYGTYDKDRLKAWLTQTNSFLKSKYNGLVVEATLHLDEATPHMHVIIVPLVKKERKKKQSRQDKELGKPPVTYESFGLCAKEMFNRKGLIDLQTDYANAMSPLGLERGQKRSKANHQTVKQYYGIAEKATSTINTLKHTVNKLKTKLMGYIKDNDEIAHDGSDEPQSPFKTPSHNPDNIDNDFTR